MATCAIQRFQEALLELGGSGGEVLPDFPLHGIADPSLLMQQIDDLISGEALRRVLDEVSTEVELLSPFPQRFETYPRSHDCLLFHFHTHPNNHLGWYKFRYK